MNNWKIKCHKRKPLKREILEITIVKVLRERGKIYMDYKNSHQRPVDKFA